jgi:hypothetical protein
MQQMDPVVNILIIFQQEQAINQIILIMILGYLLIKLEDKLWLMNKEIAIYMEITML